MSAATVRAGNVIGGGDRSANRLVPDCVRALAAGVPIEVRNPDSRRRWQHVLEPLGAYLEIAMRLDSEGDRFAGSWNVGPHLEANASVIDLVRSLVEAWGEGRFVEGRETRARHEARLLFLNSDKIRQELGWSPSWGFEDTVRTAVAWYKQVHEGAVPLQVTAGQIKEYSRAAQGKLGFLK